MADWYDPDADPGEHDEVDAADDGGSVLEQFAKSAHGREIYTLHDNGFKLADSQAEMYRVQAIVYLTAKAYWEERERDEVDDTPSKHSF